MTPDDLGRINLPSAPRCTPDGERIAFVVSTPDLDEDRYQSRIWLSDEGGTRPFTSGPGDSAARWSPGGLELESDVCPLEGSADDLPDDVGGALNLPHLMRCQAV